MKRKFIYGLLLCSLALVGCGKKEEDQGGSKKKYSITFDISGGSDQEKQAMLAAANGNILVAHGSADESLLPTSQYTMKEDDGCTLSVTTKNKSAKAEDKSKHEVSFEWKVESPNGYIDSVKDMEDGVTKYIYAKYKGYDFKTEVGKINLEITKITCGGAVATNPNIKYTVSVQNEQYHHQDVTIAQINSVTEETKEVVVSSTVTHKFPSTFDTVDYTVKEGKTYSPYFSTDPLNAGMEKDYYYVNVKGKIIYAAPDGNWALLADGDQVLELYAGSALNLDPGHYPAMAQNDGYVVVSGNLGQYNGNIQCAFITKINPLVDHSSVAEPTMNYKEVDFSKLAIDSSFGYTCQKQAIDGFSNSLGQVTGTLKNIPSSYSSSGRFTFDVETTGGDTITVAYDYHTDKQGTVGLFNKIKSLLKDHASATVTIKGTMRYTGNDSNPFLLAGNKGAWQIVPFLPEHVSF